MAESLYSTSTSFRDIVKMSQRELLKPAIRDLARVAAGERDSLFQEIPSLQSSQEQDLTGIEIAVKAAPSKQVLDPEPLRLSKAIANLYARNLRIDMKNFKRAEKLFMAFRKTIVNEASLKRSLGLLARQLEQSTKATVTLKYVAPRLSFVRSLPDRTKIIQTFVFEGGELSIYTKWEATGLVELLRATKYAADSSKTVLDFDIKVWKTYCQGTLGLSHLSKVLDICERQRLNFHQFVSKLNCKTSLEDLLKAALITRANIKTDKRSAAFIDLLNRSGQELSIKSTRLVSSISLL